MDFGTRPRLIKHLAYASKVCLLFLKAHVVPNEVQDTDRLDEEDDSERKRLAKIGKSPFDASTSPAFRVHGPLRRSAQAPC